MEVLGILASVATVISGLGWVIDRNSRRYNDMQKQSNTVLRELSQKVQNVEDTLVGVRITLPEKYVTKDELMTHIRGEERWHESVDERLRDIHDQIASLREWRHR